MVYDSTGRTPPTQIFYNTTITQTIAFSEKNVTRYMTSVHDFEARLCVANDFFAGTADSAFKHTMKCVVYDFLQNMFSNNYIKKDSYHGL